MTGLGTTLAGSVTGTLTGKVEITCEGVTIGEIDDTDLESDEWEEFISGLKRAGTWSVRVKYAKALFAKLNTDFGVSQTWTMTLPDNSTYVATGFINRVPLTVPVEQHMMIDTGIRISGEPVFTQGA
jgi:hypothetical protein